MGPMVLTRPDLPLRGSLPDTRNDYPRQGKAKFPQLVTDTGAGRFMAGTVESIAG